MRFWLALLFGLLCFALTACPVPEEDENEPAITDADMRKPDMTEDEAVAEEPGEAGEAVAEEGEGVAEEGVAVVEGEGEATEGEAVAEGEGEAAEGEAVVEGEGEAEEGMEEGAEPETGEEPEGEGH